MQTPFFEEDLVVGFPHLGIVGDLIVRDLVNLEGQVDATQNILNVGIISVFINQVEPLEEADGCMDELLGLEQILLGNLKLAEEVDDEVGVILGEYIVVDLAPHSVGFVLLQLVLFELLEIAASHDPARVPSHPIYYLPPSE